MDEEQHDRKVRGALKAWMAASRMLARETARETKRTLLKANDAMADGIIRGLARIDAAFPMEQPEEPGSPPSKSKEQ